MLYALTFIFRGGIPYLNDAFVHYLNIKHANVLFGELINYLDIFYQYALHSNSKRILNDYFQLDSIYLGFTEYLSDYGCGEENTFFVQTNTGKGKVTSQEYLKYITIFNPEYAVIPFEYIPSDCGKKRVNRCYKKIKDFFSLVALNKAAYSNQKFITPYYPHHKEFINSSELKNSLSLSKGMLVITEDVSMLSLAKIKEYRSDILFYKIDMIIKANSNTPFDILIGYLMGCNHFEVHFPLLYSEKGKSLSIDFNIFKANNSYGDIDAINIFNYEPVLLDLTDKMFENDLNKLNNNCNCFTCATDYKRAYIHHLIKCKELNGTILLMIHNVYQTQELYDTFTKLITDDDRYHYLLWFISSQCVQLNKKDK